MYLNIYLQCASYRNLRVNDSIFALISELLILMPWLCNSKAISLYTCNLTLAVRKSRTYLCHTFRNICSSCRTQNLRLGLAFSEIILGIDSGESDGLALSVSVDMVDDDIVLMSSTSISTWEYSATSSTQTKLIASSVKQFQIDVNLRFCFRKLT